MNKSNHSKQSFQVQGEKNLDHLIIQVFVHELKVLTHLATGTI